jgi:glycosyltransferase involved in cell wall biosynthesis
MDAADVLFLTQTAGASCYHRCMLPALALGADWGGLDAPPPEMMLGRGEVRFDEHGPDLGSYRIVVLQTPSHEAWLDFIPRLQAAGTKVVFDADYHIHEIATDRDVLDLIEALLGMCDGVTCATRYIADRYARFNPRTSVCENGIDLRPYALTRPPHDTVNIGWLGSSMQAEEAMPWLVQIAAMMRVREVTNFVSIGQRLGDAVAAMGAVVPERCLAIPGMFPEQVPAAMSIFDIAFDPVGQQPWRLGRSQLRWLESSAWGIPLVGDPRIYPNIEHGVTGFHASDPIEIARTVLRLVDDPLLRAAVGGRARRHVEERYTMAAVAPQWMRALEQVAA